tara:strand:- start:758 stop:952 length:195 start_codon:yes stop_codon:yes gene_type:complete
MNKNWRKTIREPILKTLDNTALFTYFVIGVFIVSIITVFPPVIANILVGLLGILGLIWLARRCK